MNYQLLPFKPIQVIQVKQANKDMLLHLLSNNIDTPLIFITDQLVVSDQNEILKFKLTSLFPYEIQSIYLDIQESFLIIQSQQYIKVLYLKNDVLDNIYTGENKYVFGIPFINIGNQLYGYKEGTGIVNIQSQQLLYAFADQILNMLKVEDKIWILTETKLICINENGQVNHQQALVITGESYNQCLYLIEWNDEKYFLVTTQNYLMIYQKKIDSDELIDLSKGYQISYSKDLLTRSVVNMYILDKIYTDDECIIQIAVITQKGVTLLFKISISDIDTIVERQKYEQVEQILRRETILFAGANTIVTKTKLIHLNQQ